ncbi:2'-5' RNA ligase family protein [Microbacterium sp.]|uniref:2'-5' RNA ligase family protein n=1 Tax=Microbacterium sp. TaxID=51671 RepID=UPI00333FD126
MDERADIMTDPRQRESLEGQQYVVLRPGGGVAAAYADVQRTLLGLAPEGTKHPNVGHVTLRGFFEPDRVPQLRDEVRSWATAQQPIPVAVDALDVFPAPFRIPILRIARHPALVGAYAGLTATLDRTDFRRIGELSPADWTFHMSVLYGKELSDSDWAVVESGLEGLAVGSPAVVVPEIEFVWYDGGEHREAMPLSRGAAGRAPS